MGKSSGLTCNQTVAYIERLEVNDASLEKTTYEERWWQWYNCLVNRKHHAIYPAQKVFQYINLKIDKPYVEVQVQVDDWVIIKIALSNHPSPQESFKEVS